MQSQYSDKHLKMGLKKYNVSSLKLRAKGNWRRIWAAISFFQIGREIIKEYVFGKCLPYAQMKKPLSEIQCFNLSRL